jgi:hypothetical protein
VVIGAVSLSSNATADEVQDLRNTGSIPLQLRTLSSDHPVDGPPFDQVAL